MKKKMIIFISILLAFQMALFAKNIKIKKIGAKKSAVTFNHTQHKKRTTCKKCHHKGTVRDGCGKSNCHKGSKGMRAVHKTCISECHRPQKKGPRACKQCHK